MYSPPPWTARLLAVTVAAAASLAAVAGTAAAATPGSGVSHGHNHEGGNWGGYVSSGDFTTATASWIEPAVTCNSSKEIVSPWVGIDGEGSSTVEQTGVDTDCAGGEPVKRVWYEMYPGDSVYYSADETRWTSVTGSPRPSPAPAMTTNWTSATRRRAGRRPRPRR
ncbi:G1 family glutamic endopeptidase [Amycolatopsis panacis]|uniref:G1 family glutamic endopeptidase n=1 Tax=Amycolatopsis panacis TaxID=2340917 RepID=UPI001F276839|nr:G1 family glutamic endopeptidase [Amycolatopsis panacis]